MPGKALAMAIAGTILQYTLLLLLYYFLFRVVKIIYLDLQNPKITNPTLVHPADLKPATLKVQAASVQLAQPVFELAETTSIGRSDANDIVINEAYVSHEHACISFYKQQYWLADLNSTNGTFVNGQRITGEVPLRSGDIIKIGSVSFKFER
ncbi:FHA domain containing protein [Thermosinus carboxydivorans Nor1]|uniref:FHA domain containing protein n=1 Tax=Thermosinus carboxydivorans Nor1 TaxID=401526 RepID=A1HMX1_9FIRM|nr:FHA domain-containing protein [Thermosinus carboxydivorans]EAX48603.1 FHA domain containing protein [Thermosinus carboxydivorans Nor1]